MNMVENCTNMNMEILKNNYGATGDCLLKYCQVDGTVEDISDGNRTE